MKKDGTDYTEVCDGGLWRRALVDVSGESPPKSMHDCGAAVYARLSMARD